MKVIVAGSRTITDYRAVEVIIDRSRFMITEFVSGAAPRGVDALGERYAVAHGFIPRLFPADWDNLGKGAGFIRNQQMEEYSDALIAIWDGVSKGTMDMVNRMRKAGKPIQLARVHIPTEILHAR